MNGPVANSKIRMQVHMYIHTISTFFSCQPGRSVADAAAAVTVIH
jgi:hypothetical protein